MVDIQCIINQINNLKPIPRVAEQIMRIIGSGEYNLRHLTEILCYDAAMTANLIRMANSAWFKRSQPCDTLHQAVVFLGVDQVVQLALMSASAECLKRGQPGYQLAQGHLWRYSVCSALVAKELAARKAIGDKHMIYTAALLKDIGKIVLSQHVAEHFMRIDEVMAEKGCDFMAAERAVIGIDHAELGGLLLKTWNFSDTMVRIVANHHEPQRAGLYVAEASVVYLADVLCMMAGINDGTDGLDYTFYRNVVEHLRITSTEMQHIMMDIPEKLEMIALLNGEE